jgi:hypothetical protein
LSQSIRRFTSAITSGPMPSPGRSSSLWVAIDHFLIQLVMAGLVPAIQVLPATNTKDVDARHKAGHDEDYR